MSVLLDAFALIAYLGDEPAAPEVQRMLWEDSPAMSSVQVAEVVDRMIRVYGADADEIEILPSALGIEIVAFEAGMGLTAGLLRSRYYLETGRSLSLADCACAATALHTGYAVATADPILAEVLTAEGAQVRRLPATG